MRRFILAVTLLTSAATAQEAPPAPAAASRADAIAKLMAADTDKDGQWSKAEWTAAGRRERGFAFLDADANGLLTQAELKTGMNRMRARRSAE